MSILLVRNVQSNILRYHNRKYARFVFISFDKIAKATAVKDWVGTILKDFQITSEATGLKDYKNFKKKKPNNGRILSLHFSAKGFRKMGFKKTDDGLPKDSAFWEGMEARGPSLNDPDKKNWEPDYKKNMEAMVLIADDSISVIEDTMSALDKSLHEKKIGEIIFYENAISKKNDSNHNIEQFGYRDGLTQPVFWNKERLLQDKWNLVLDNNRGGSYLVFRKLEQNVKLFNEKVKAMSKQIQLPESYVGARVIGRYKDGVHLEDGSYPPVKNPDPKRPTNFDEDPDGMKCPFHSHSRKMHAATYDEKQRMIVRRGVTYDDRIDKKDPEPEKGVGLLFLCYQASIENQFETLQSKWANNPDYPQKHTGIDPLIGQTDNITKRPARRVGYNTAKESLQLNGTVTLKGGAYFYAPGIPFLKDIKSYPRKDNFNSGYNIGSVGFGILSSFSSVNGNSGGFNY